MRALSSFRLRVGVIAIFAIVTLPCFAGEVAVLKNGFTIRHERREVLGETTRLYVSADGASYVDVPTAEIDHYEEAPPLPASDPMSLAKNVNDRPVNDRPVSDRPTGFPAPPMTSPKTDLSEVVNDASGRYRLDPDLVNSVIKAESGFNVRAVSPKGAQGLMQLMPGTAAELGVANTFDAQANVEGGTRYLRELLERYNFDLVKALAAYNAGPQRVEQFGGVPPYYETRAYVARVVRDFNKKKLNQNRALTTKNSSAQSSKAKSSSADKNSQGHNSQNQNSQNQDKNTSRKASKTANVPSGKASGANTTAKATAPPNE
jgi:hypothetical protein